MKHIQTRYLWTQERVAAGHLTLTCVKSEDNHADLLTKTLAFRDISKHMAAIGQCFEAGRAQVAKEVLN